jgi:hypothetical protein
MVTAPLTGPAGPVSVKLPALTVVASTGAENVTPSTLVKPAPTAVFGGSVAVTLGPAGAEAPPPPPLPPQALSKSIDTSNANPILRFVELTFIKLSFEDFYFLAGNPSRRVRPSR